MKAQCLSKTGQHAEAIRVLERAKRLSGDPMIRYMIAKNRQTLGDYREAEEELLQAIGILPERLYHIIVSQAICRAGVLPGG
ncbi:MAG: CDC27 family protein [Parabacteroides merdae]